MTNKRVVIEKMPISGDEKAFVRIGRSEYSGSLDFWHELACEIKDAIEAYRYENGPMKDLIPVEYWTPEGFGYIISGEVNKKLMRLKAEEVENGYRCIEKARVSGKIVYCTRSAHMNRTCHIAHDGSKVFAIWVGDPNKNSQPKEPHRLALKELEEQEGEQNAV